MNSTTNIKKPRKSRTPKLLNTEPKLSKKVLSNITILSYYNSNKPLNQLMIKLVQDMYKSRDITNFKTADIALNLLTSGNDFNKFQPLFDKILKLQTKKTERKNIRKAIKEENKYIY
jgi:hypothetical protein